MLRALLYVGGRAISEMMKDLYVGWGSGGKIAAKQLAVSERSAERDLPEGRAIRRRIRAGRRPRSRNRDRRLSSSGIRAISGLPQPRRGPTRTHGVRRAAPDRRKP